MAVKSRNAEEHCKLVETGKAVCLYGGKVNL